MADLPPNRLRCIVVTPEKSVVDTVVDALVVPLYDGELGVLPGRLALVARLGAGELRLGSGDKPTSYFIDGGFVQVRDNVVTLLTTQAIPRQQLDPVRARGMLDAALADTTLSPEERLEKAGSARAMLRLAPASGARS
jgi:F-type H+-transporting ATPase subunit epsilon